MENKRVRREKKGEGESTRKRYVLGPLLRRERRGIGKTGLPLAPMATGFF